MQCGQEIDQMLNVDEIVYVIQIQNNIYLFTVLA